MGLAVPKLFWILLGAGHNADGSCWGEDPNLLAAGPNADRSCCTAEPKAIFYPTRGMTQRYWVL
jgi:hypothetical protein